MRFKWNIFFLFTASSIGLLLTHCSNYKEHVPFSDGLHFEYQTKINRSIYIDKYDIQRLEKGNFKITQMSFSDVRPGREDIETFHVNAYGRVYKTSRKAYDGIFSPIWIPVNTLRVGDKYDDGFTILRRDKWKGWDVLVSKNPLFEMETYFDQHTGFMVGAFIKSGAGSSDLVLVNTNAGIPVFKVE